MRLFHPLLALLFVIPPVGAIAQTSAQTSAQKFPTNVVTVVSPYQAGGTSDIIARLLGQKLSERWGQSVVIENKPGANGSIGVNTVTRAAPDGHTLLAVASSALTLNPLVYKTIAYNVERDLAPVTRTGLVANVLVVNPSVPAKTLQELVAIMKAKPKNVIYASQGIGSNGQVSAEMFARRAGVELLHVPYKGSSPAVKDLLSGNVHLMFDNLPSVLPLIRAGKLRAIAVTTAQRSDLLPDVPTVAESGYPGYETDAWFAILVAKSTPEALRARLESDIVAVMQEPEVKEKLHAVGVVAKADGSAALAETITKDTKMWREVITQAGIKVE